MPFIHQISANVALRTISNLQKGNHKQQLLDHFQTASKWYYHTLKFKNPSGQLTKELDTFYACLSKHFEIVVPVQPIPAPSLSYMSHKVEVAHAFNINFNARDDNLPLQSPIDIAFINRIVDGYHRTNYVESIIDGNQNYNHNNNNRYNQNYNDNNNNHYNQNYNDNNNNNYNQNYNQNNNYHYNQNYNDNNNNNNFHQPSNQRCKQPSNQRCNNNNNNTNQRCQSTF